MLCYLFCAALVVVLFLYLTYIPLPEKLHARYYVALTCLLSRIIHLYPGRLLSHFLGPDWHLWWTRKLTSVLKLSVDPTKEHDVIITNEHFDGVPVRIYQPKNSEVQGAIIYIHGGGMVILQPDHYDLTSLRLTRETKRTVVSIGYRLAPENPFPAAVEDCDAATSYFLGHCQRLYGVKPDNVVIMGDSAGGNLSAVTANRLSKREGQKLKGQVLIYPWMQFVDFQSPSYQQYYAEYKDTGLLDPESTSRWFLNYTGTPTTTARINDVMNNNHVTKEGRQNDLFKNVNHDALPQSLKTFARYDGVKCEQGNGELYESIKPFIFNPDFSPLMNPDLSGAPPALVITCGYDIIRDDGVWYAEKLKSTGVPVQWLHYGDTVHGIFSFPTDYATKIFVKIAEFIKRLDLV